MIHCFVLHYEDRVKTSRCLVALLYDIALMQPGVRVFAIDNGSPNPLPELFGSSVHVIRHKENLPLIEAFNRAMEAAPANYYVCITNDTRPTPGMVKTLVTALKAQNVGIVAPGTNDQGAGILFTGDGPDKAMPIVETNHVDNTCWAWRHDLVKAIGWPDCEGHPHRANWASNRDYCYRARQAGYKVLAVRGAHIWHAHNGGQDAVADAAGREWLQGKWGDKFAEVWA